METGISSSFIDIEESLFMGVQHFVPDDARLKKYFGCELQFSPQCAGQKVKLCRCCLIIGTSHPPPDLPSNLTLHIELRDSNNAKLKQ